MFAVGDTLKVLKYVERRDGRSRVNVGDEVRVLTEFKFQFQGKQCQDITIQRGNDLPIAVIVKPGCFERVGTISKP